MNIDDDTLRLIRALAVERGESLGKTVSYLVKKAYRSSESRIEKNGVPILKPKDGLHCPATLELVNRLRDGEEA